MDFDVDLALSWLQDFWAHYSGNVPHSTAEDNVEVCMRLLTSSDAELLFNKQFLDELQRRVLSRRADLIKQAEDHIETMKLGFRG
jgi:hypothetical protein